MLHYFFLITRVLQANTRRILVRLLDKVCCYVFFVFFVVFLFFFLGGGGGGGGRGGLLFWMVGEWTGKG